MEKFNRRHTDEPNKKQRKTQAGQREEGGQVGTLMGQIRHNEAKEAKQNTPHTGKGLSK